MLPGAPEVDSRFQQDMFAAKHNFEDQPRLTARAFQIAHRLGARIVRGRAGPEPDLASLCRAHSQKDGQRNTALKR